MGVAKARFQPAGQGLIGQQRVQIHRRLGNPDAMPVGRDSGMQVGQRLAVVEPVAFRHEAVEQRQHAIGAIDEAAQDLVRIDAGAFTALIEPGLGAGCVLGMREIGEGEEVAGNEMAALFLEIGLALGIEQCRGRIWKTAVGIGCGLLALRFHEDRPARAETSEGIVEARGDGDQFGSDGGFEVWTAKLRGPLQRSVLVQNDALADERGPGQEIREAAGGAAIFGKVQHGRAPQTAR